MSHRYFKQNTFLLSLNRNILSLLSEGVVFAADMFLHWLSDILNIEEKPKKNRQAKQPGLPS